MAKRLTVLSVYVYFNLHKKLWSVKSRKTGRVLYHAEVVLLYDCWFRVGQAGRKRVLKEKRKNVHAGIAGTFDWAGTHKDFVGQDTQPEYSFARHWVMGVPGGNPGYPVSVTYDPYKHESFVREDNLHAVDRGGYCVLDVKETNKLLVWWLE